MRIFLFQHQRQGPLLGGSGCCHKYFSFTTICTGFWKMVPSRQGKFFFVPPPFWNANGSPDQRSQTTSLLSISTQSGSETFTHMGEKYLELKSGKKLYWLSHRQKEQHWSTSVIITISQHCWSQTYEFRYLGNFPTSHTLIAYLLHIFFKFSSTVQRELFNTFVKILSEVNNKNFILWLVDSYMIATSN